MPSKLYNYLVKEGVESIKITVYHLFADDRISRIRLEGYFVLNLKPLFNTTVLWGGISEAEALKQREKRSKKIYVYKDGQLLYVVLGSREFIRFFSCGYTTLYKYVDTDKLYLNTFVLSREKIEGNNNIPQFTDGDLFKKFVSTVDIGGYAFSLPQAIELVLDNGKILHFGSIIRAVSLCGINPSILYARLTDSEKTGESFTIRTPYGRGTCRLAVELSNLESSFSGIFDPISKTYSDITEDNLK